MNYLEIIEKFAGFGLIIFGVYFIRYAYMNQNWKGYEMAITTRRYIVGVLSIIMGTLVLFSLADLF